MPATRALALALTLAACGGPSQTHSAARPSSGSGDVVPMALARQVSRNAAGGVIALTGDATVARIGANAMMSAHCKDYQIVAEGEEVVGQDEVRQADGDAVGSTTPVTEWRVHYTCATAAPE